MTIDLDTKTACAALGVSPALIWEKIGRSVIKAGRFAPQEALRVIRSGVLTDNEKALLVTAGIELIASRMSPPPFDCDGGHHA